MTPLCPQRLLRARTERLYLIDQVLVNPSQMMFKVMGSTGNLYDLNLKENSSKWSCQCPDYQKRRLTCKHQLFILERVLGLSTQSSLTTIWTKAQERLSASSKTVDQTAEAPEVYRRRYNAEKDKKGEEVTQRPYLNEECCICMETMQFEDEIIFCKRTCGRSLHRHCFEMWAKHQRTKLACPFCRTPGHLEEDDEASGRKRGRYVNLIRPEDSHQEIDDAFIAALLAQDYQEDRNL